jgi:hypothetical protein
MPIAGLYWGALVVCTPEGRCRENYCKWKDAWIVTHFLLHEARKLRDRYGPKQFYEVMQGSIRLHTDPQSVELGRLVRALIRPLRHSLEFSRKP